MDFLLYPLALIVTLGVLVTIHELGHFLIARRSGVRVVRFSVGFGKPIWSRRDRSGDGSGPDRPGHPSGSGAAVR